MYFYHLFTLGARNALKLQQINTLTTVHPRDLIHRVEVVVAANKSAWLN